MKDDGVDISQNKSNHISEFEKIDFDFIITVCDHANETCPSYFSKKAVRIHKNFFDPSKIEDEEKATLQTNYQKLSGPKTTGEKINLEEVTEKEKTVEDARKRKRKRINKDLKNPKLSDIPKRKTNRPTPLKKEEPSEEEVQKQIRETLE